ncbi:hypothetical protein LC607_25955 [Nostoc sp. CHAB 5824]|nr:hypothetical protein [Nostoc sp. CHAB 5824]
MNICGFTTSLSELENSKGRLEATTFNLIAEDEEAWQAYLVFKQKS